MHSVEFIKKLNISAKPKKVENQRRMQNVCTPVHNAYGMNHEKNRGKQSRDTLPLSAFHTLYMIITLICTELISF